MAAKSTLVSENKITQLTKINNFVVYIATVCYIALITTVKQVIKFISFLSNGRFLNVWLLNYNGIYLT